MLNRILPNYITHGYRQCGDVVIFLDGKQIVPALPGDKRLWDSVSFFGKHGYCYPDVRASDTKVSVYGNFTIKWNAAYEAKLAKEDGAILYQAFKDAHVKKYGVLPTKYVNQPDHLIIGFRETRADVDISHKLPELYNSSAAAQELIALAKEDGFELHTYCEVQHSGGQDRPRFKVTRVEKHAPIFIKVEPMPLSFGFTAGAVEEVKSAYIGNRPIPTNHIERAMKAAKAIDSAIENGLSAADAVTDFSNAVRDAQLREAVANLVVRNAEVERLRSLVKEFVARAEVKDREIKSLDAVCNRLAVSAKEKEGEIVALRGRISGLIQTRGDLRVTLGRIIDLCDLGVNAKEIRKTADNALRGI